MRHTTRSRVLAAALLLALLLAACGAKDRPPDDGTPEPPALSGVYVSGDSALTFNGDGQSVTLEVSDALAAASGLPAGRHEGTYVFLFHNGSWRRDKAESFRITVDGESYLFRNGLGLTDEDTVAAYLIEDAEAVCFEQVAAGKAGA